MKISRPTSETPGRRVERPCDQCGKAFWPLVAYVEAGKGRHCSKTCSARAFRKPKPWACVGCGAETLSAWQVGPKSGKCKNCRGCDRDALSAENRAAKFLVRARAKFGDVHDYGGTRYVDALTPVTITCPAHGPFERTPASYLNAAHGCPDCCTEARARTRREYVAANKALYRAAEKRSKAKPRGRARVLCQSMVRRMATSICKANGRLAFTRGGATAKCLGYTTEDFREHIDALFEPWMTWANHGEWHVDHIVPVAYYLARGIDDPAIVNALSNLRPLAAQANIAKSDRLDEDALALLRQMEPDNDVGNAHGKVCARRLAHM